MNPIIHIRICVGENYFYVKDWGQYYLNKLIDYARVNRLGQCVCLYDDAAY